MTNETYEGVMLMEGESKKLSLAFRDLAKSQILQSLQNFVLLDSSVKESS
jgi:hypothetical protein